MTETMRVPPIPATLAERPTVGGLVIPWVNVRLADGGVDFRGQHRARAEQAIARALCQVCGQPLDPDRAVLLGGPAQLRSLLFGEPPLHPTCAAYTARACPMVAGRMTHHPDRPQVSHGPRGQACPTPGCDCDGWISAPGPERDGARAADPWWALIVSAYTPIRDQHGQLLAMCTPEQVRGARLVSRPGEGYHWKSIPVAEALRDYTAPLLKQVAHG